MYTIKLIEHYKETTFFRSLPSVFYLAREKGEEGIFFSTLEGFERFEDRSSILFPTKLIARIKFNYYISMYKDQELYEDDGFNNKESSVSREVFRIVRWEDISDIKKHYYSKK